MQIAKERLMQERKVSEDYRCSKQDTELEKRPPTWVFGETTTLSR